MSIFDPSNRLARDIADGWFKFENVGDQIGGIIEDMFEMPARGAMPAQRCFTIKTENGELKNVGLKRTNYILTRTDNLQVGDELGVRFEKEIPAKEKGFNAAKSMVIFTKLNGPRGGALARDLETTENGPSLDDAFGKENKEGGDIDPNKVPF